MADGNRDCVEHIWKKKVWGCTRENDSCIGYGLPGNIIGLAFLKNVDTNEHTLTL